ncbi:MAG: hypothetical protein ACT4PO_01815 [Actinomycetota bacterium]
MNADAGQDGLRQSLESMVALESRLDESLAALPRPRGTWRRRPSSARCARSWPGSGRPSRPISRGSARRTCPWPLRPSPRRSPCAALTETALGYAVLHALAHRFYEVDTANLADQHRTNYLQAVQAVHQAIADAVVQELQDAGHACRCECPACGPASASAGTSTSSRR